MSLLNFVNFKMSCPVCSNKDLTWQSKDLEYLGRLVEPEEVRYFNTFCKQCKTAIDFEKVEPSIAHREVPLTYEEVVAKGYEMSIRTF